jgi:ATP-dependent protease HslVU (ClpYQ) ATPase subunit
MWSVGAAERDECRLSANALPYPLKSVLQRFFVHNVMMIGPAGAGKTLLARAMAKTVFSYNQFEHVEMTQVAETTHQMRADLKNLNGVEYKNHRVYHKSI